MELKAEILAEPQRDGISGLESGRGHQGEMELKRGLPQGGLGVKKPAKETEEEQPMR